MRFSTVPVATSDLAACAIGTGEFLRHPVGQEVCGNTRRSHERCGCSSEWCWEQNYAAGVLPACVDVALSQRYSFLRPKLPLFTPASTHATASAAPAA